MSKIEYILRKALVGVLILLIFLIMSLVLYINTPRLTLRPANCDVTVYNYCITHKSTQSFDGYTRDKLMSIVNDELNTQYLYKYVDLGTAKGLTNIFLKLIYLNKNLSNAEYIRVLAHEICHLKYMSSDECYVEYMTFVTLYNSSNELLRLVSLDIALEHLTGRVDDDYNCSYYISKYLNKEIMNV